MIYVEPEVLRPRRHLADEYDTSLQAPGRQALEHRFSEYGAQHRSYCRLLPER